MWRHYSQMVLYRDFIEYSLESLPSAEALLRRMRSERSVKTALGEPEITNGGLRKKYNVPDSRSWVELWWRYAADHYVDDENRTSPAPDPDWRKRSREDDNGEEESARSRKPVSLDSTDRIKSSRRISAKQAKANGDAEVAQQLGLQSTANSLKSNVPSIKRSRKPVAKTNGTSRPTRGRRGRLKVENALQPPVNNEIKREWPKLKRSSTTANRDVPPRSSGPREEKAKTTAKHSGDH